MKTIATLAAALVFACASSSTPPGAWRDITHGDWQHGSDGGLRVNACAGLDAQVLETQVQCVYCTAAEWGDVPARCEDAWKKASGKPPPAR